jgi:sugar phosphate isomerase/epimerase
MAARHGITILLENMFDYRQEDLNGTALVRTPEGLRSICESFDAATFGLTYDPANFYLAGVESFPFAYEALHKYIRNVHVKDAYKYVEWLHGSRDGLPVWPDSITGLYVSVPPGKGAVNWHAILHRLHRDQYAGFLTVDILTTPNGFQSAYSETVQYLQSLLLAQNG